jgi:SH3 domain protein
MIKKTFLGLTLLTCCVAVLAQEPIIQEAIAQEATKQAAADPDKDRQYVTDQLRLSLYSQASSSSKVVKLLQSGDVLEIEQIQGPYALVTAPGGVKGWVKRGFLVSKPTSNLLLLEEQQKTEALTAEIEKLSNSKVVIDQYEKDMDKLVGQVDALEAEKQKANESIADLQQELAEKQRQLDRKDEDSAPALLVLLDTFKKYWKYIVPVIFLIILLSYLVSKVIVEARIRSKFHGIKIW